MRKFKVTITFKRANRVVAKVVGEHEVGTEAVTIDEYRKLIECEAIIERFTGLRVHIDQETTQE